MLYLFQHIFLWLTIAWSLLALYNRRVMSASLFTVAGIRKGEWYRLLSSGFVHSDYMHLAFNMFTFYWFAYLWGDIYTRYFSFPWWLFGVFYFSSILIVNCIMWLLHRTNSNYAALGASGGVSAVVFSVVILFPWETLHVFIFPMPAIVFSILYLAYSAWATFFPRRGDRISHAAHLVGAVYGMLFVWVMEPDVWRLFFQELLRFPF